MMKCFIRFLFSARFFKIAACFWLLVALGVVTTYLVLDHKGSAAWKEYLAAHPDTPLDLKPFIRPPIPPETNYAAIPIFEAAFKGSSTSPLKLPKGIPLASSLEKAERCNLATARDWLLNSGVLEGPTESPAKDILRMLEKYEPHLQQIRAAEARPDSRFPVNWEEGGPAKLPHQAFLLQAATIFRSRGICHLATGDSAAALREAESILRIYQAMRDEGMLVSGLLRAAYVRRLLDLAWEGLAGQQWKEPELVRLEEIFGKIDLLADGRHAMASERGAMNQLMERIYHEGDRPFREFGGIMGGFHESIYPKGWIRSNQVLMNRLMNECVERLRGPHYDPHSPLWEATERSWVSLYHVYRDVFAKNLFSSMGRIVDRIWQSHVGCLQVRVAIALERHRQAQGAYPEALSALPGALPVDPMNGKPFGYRRTEKGYLLWSVGVNQVDDGGDRGVLTGNKHIKDWV